MYPITFLKSLNLSIRIIDFISFSAQTIVLLVNADSVNSHFLISISFIYFSCLIIAGRKPDAIGCGAKYWAATFDAAGR